MESKPRLPFFNLPRLLFFDKDQVIRRELAKPRAKHGVNIPQILFFFFRERYLTFVLRLNKLPPAYLICWCGSTVKQNKSTMSRRYIVIDLGLARSFL